MARSRGRKAIPGVDETLPWEESVDLVGSAAGGKRPAPDPLEVASAATSLEGAAPATPGDERRAHCPAGHPYDDVNTYMNRKG